MSISLLPLSGTESRSYPLFYRDELLDRHGIGPDDVMEPGGEPPGS